MTAREFPGEPRTLINTVQISTPGLFQSTSGRLSNALEEIINIEKDVEIYNKKTIRNN